MKKYINNNQSLYFFISVFIFISCSNDIIEININQEKKGSLKSNEYDYYKLTLPEEINKDEQIVFELEPNTELDSINNIVSDPNLYISINDIRPTETEHKWSSNRFGDETITINGEYLNPLQYYYIGVHCKEKCNYILKTSLVKTINIKENIINSFTLETQTVMKFSFKTRTTFNELSVNIVGSFINSFNVYLAKNDASSSNTLPAEPIFFNGYKFTIKNGDMSNNNDVTYELIVDNRNQKQELSIWLKYDDEIIKIKEAEIMYDTISQNKANCYYYEIGAINLNKDIIISTTLFNGLGFIYIEGYEAVFPKDISENYKTKDNSYNIIQNRVIHLTEKELKEFGQNNKNGEQLNFCFYAEQDTSLFIKVYFYENFKKMQKLNYIFPGIKIEDILPKKSLTRYNMIDFNIKNDLNIYLTIKKGNPKLYLYMAKPERNNDLLDYNNFQPYKEEDIVLEGQGFYDGFRLYLTKEVNKCKFNQKTNKYSCNLNAVVECDSNEECIYNLLFDHSKKKVIMEDKQIYTNVISEKEIDTYSIIINDPSVKNIAIVLTQNTGRTVMKFDSFVNKQGDLQHIRDIINNDDFMPGVFKISDKTFTSESLVGTLNLTVEGLSYASYSLYYYTFNEEENEEYLDQDKVSMKLVKGKIIKDIFMDNHKFKIYLYDNINNGNQTNLYISLIETDTIELELYVYKDLNDFSIKDNRIFGYLWKGNYYDYLCIDKNDKKYLENDILYIMIYKKTKTKNNVYTTFYLGVTDENTPLLLNEGIEFKQKFDRNHFLQKYFYYYINDGSENQDLSISLSLFSGVIIVTVKIDESLYCSEKINSESYLIYIRYFKIKQLCNNKPECPINIEISSDIDYSYYSSFLIGIKSSKNVPIYLKQGVVNKRTILSGEKQNFIIDLKPDEKNGARIIAYFEKGQGQLYARKLLKSELNNITNFPDENNYEYIATYKTSNNNLYIIEIPYEEIANINPCKILLTIKGNIPGYFTGTSIEYSLSISNSLNEIDTDKNYRLFISQGDISYFHFKIGPNKKRLYISMTNKEQDAYMFLNYGKYITSISDYHWKNIGGYNEYLDLSVENTFFTERQMKDIEGDYYLAIHALNDCFYTLYISTQDVKILSISKDMPAGCSCEKQNEYCYFRYENVNDPKDTDLKEQGLIFYTEYTYGKGDIFGKIYPNGNMEEIIKGLPSLTNKDYQGQNEFLYVFLHKGIEKYTLSSVLIIGIQCQQKSLFDLSIANLDISTDVARNTDNFIFLKLNQDNLYYINPFSGKTHKFVYYLSKDEDFNFQVKSIICKAEVHTFVNGSLVYHKFLDDAKRNNKDYHHISDFTIDSNDENKKIYNGNVPKQYGKSNYFFTVIKPFEPCLININVHYDIEMSFIPLNKEIIANVNKYNYYAYFDLLKDSEEVVITITSVEKSKQFKLFLKQNIIKNDLTDLNSQKEYSKPNELNYDKKGESSSLTSSLSLRIKNVPKKLRDNSIIRVLVNLETKNYSINQKFKILVTPVINRINTINPQPSHYYFTDIENTNNEKTLFILNNKNEEDNIMVIEISTCKGKYMYFLLDSPPLETETLLQLQKRKMFLNSYPSNGKEIIIVRFLQVKEYYLLVFGDYISNLDIMINEKDDEERGEENDKKKEIKTNRKVEILLFYYTTNTKKYNYLVTEDSFNYESKKDNTLINFKLPELKKRDAFGKENYVDYMKYTFIVSEQKNDFELMESTCYLTKLLQKYEKNNQYNYLKAHYDKKNNIMSVEGFMEGKTYYMNILGKNEYTGEIITYKPIMIVFTKIISKVKIFSIIFLSILFFIFIFIAFYFYRKYRIKKAQIESFETTQDPDNIMKKSKKINLNVIKKEYSNLSEDTKEINAE